MAGSDVAFQGSQTRGREMAGVIGVEDELDAPALVLAVELRIAIVVADQRAAAKAADREDAEVAAGAREHDTSVQSVNPPLLVSPYAFCWFP